MTRRRAALTPALLAGLLIVGSMTTVAVFAPLLAPHQPQAISGDSLEPPSLRHPLGTDNIGQDIFSRLIWGARWSLSVAIAAAAIALAVAIVAGVGVALVGGVVDVVVMRVVDVLLAMPVLPLLILVGALFGPSWSTVVVTIGLLGWPATARMLRSQTLSLRTRGFVSAARGFGAGPGYVVRRHLVPALGPLAVTSFVGLASFAIFVEAGLAFLGLADPTAVSWGAVLDQALRHPGLYYSTLWARWVLPAGLAITVSVLGLMLLGIGLEPVLNPRLRRPR